MQRSVARILTTHVGSLPFLSLNRGVAAGDQTRLKEDVAAIVARQRDIGIDIINEGEYAKGGYKVSGIFYAAAAPCFIAALFLLFLYFARPVMEADAAAPGPAE